MALLFQDGFDMWGADATTFPSLGWVRYSGAANANLLTFTTAARRYGTVGKGMRGTQAGTVGGSTVADSQYLLYNIGPEWTAGDDIYVGFSYRPTTLNAAGQGLCGFSNAGGDILFGIGITAAGYLELRENDASPVLEAAVSSALAEGAWSYIEIHLTNLAGDAEAIEVKINGVTVISYATTILVAAALVDVVVGGCPEDQTNALLMGLADFDDLYGLDDTGAIRNTYLGESRIETLFVDAEVTNTGYARTGGADIEDAMNTLDGDTSYYEADAAADIVVFSSTETLENTPANIHAVAITHVTAKTDAGVRTVAPVIRETAVNYDGAAEAVSSSYGAFQDIWEQNPNGSVDWTRTTVEAADFGVKVVS